MKHQLTILAALLAATPALAQPATQAVGTNDQWSNGLPMNEPQFVVSNQGDCIVLGLKRHLLDGQITRLAVSPHGKYAVAQRVLFTDPQFFGIFAGINREPLKSRLTLVNTSTNRAVDFPVDPVKVAVNIAAVLDSGFLFASVTSGDTTQTVIFAPSGRMDVFSSNQSPAGSIVTPEAVKLGQSDSYALVEYVGTRQDGRFDSLVAKCVLINAQGAVTRDITSLTAGASGVYTYPDDPNRLTLFKGKQWYVVNLTTALATVGERPLPDLDSERFKPRLVCSGQSTKYDGTLWRMQFTEPRFDEPTNSTQPNLTKAKLFSAVIGVNLGQAYVADDQSAVFLTDTGGLDVIPLQPVDLAVYNAMLKRKAQNEAMTKAKMVSLGMLMYGADWDDMLPMSNNWSDAVMPYLKNKDLVTNFQYLGDGENMKDVKDPAKTELGIISTPYGEAVAYLDGHVVWRGNKSGGLCLTILAPYSKPNPDLLNPQPTLTLIDPDSAKETPRDVR